MRPLDCDACGKCVKVCPERLRRISGEWVSASELAQRLEKNKNYYSSVGGGVTFSGGEPLMQADFVMETLSLLTPSVHKAAETSGYGSFSNFSMFMEQFDLIMFDLKSMDDNIHKRFTGVSNHLILKNARKLCEGKIPFIIRIPVIPGVNDNNENYRAVAEFLSGATALIRVELLPYHKTAGAKYAMAGKTYNPGFDTEQSVMINTSIFSEKGIRSSIL